MTASQSEVTQSRVVIGTPALGPVEQTISLVNLHIVDACITVMHNAFNVKLPVFVSIRTKPLSRIIMELISKSNRDSIAIERPQFLDEPVVQFALPFAHQEPHNLLATVNEFGPVPPHTVRRIRERDL